MTYLFGDSTPSPLQSNFIDFLRDALDCWVRVLNVAEHLGEAKDKGLELEAGLKAEVARLDALGKLAVGAVEDAPLCEPNSPTMRCAEAIIRSVNDLVRVETDKARAVMQAELTRLATEGGNDRETCTQALGALLIKHGLPDATSELRFGQLGGVRYSARERAVSATGIEALFELEIAANHVLAHVLQISRVIERLEVQVPEPGKGKVKSQRLDKEYVTELYAGDNETKLKLRTTADGGGAGFDVTITAGNGRPVVTLARTGGGDATPFQLGDADAAKIIDLRDKLLAACRELVPHRKSMVDVRLDGTALREHGNPRLIVERMISAVAPLAREIAKRSLSPNELTLKRSLGDGRREEIFVSKSELQQKIIALAPSLRALFTPLGFTDGLPAPTPEKVAAPKAAVAKITPAKIAVPKVEAPAPDKPLLLTKNMVKVVDAADIAEEEPEGEKPPSDA